MAAFPPSKTALFDRVRRDVDDDMLRAISRAEKQDGLLPYDGHHCSSLFGPSTDEDVQGFQGLSISV